MQRLFRPLFWVFTFFLMVSSAQAASYIVTPFQINGPSGFAYLEKAIPPMLSSRLLWQGSFEPAPGQDSVLKGKAPTSENEAKNILNAQKADFVVWGSVSVVGEEASMDVRVLGKDGKTWSQSAQSPVSNLVSGLQSVADSINSQVFGRAVTRSPQSASGGVRPLNQDFVVNESQGDVYLNPEMRYQSTETDKLRSQAVSYESWGMEVVDLDGDGKQEIVLMGEKALRAYRWNDTRLEEIGSVTFNNTMNPLIVRSFERNGKAFIAVSMYDKTSKEPRGYIYTFGNGTFTQYGSALPYFINVIKLPPNFKPTLVGQRGERTRTYIGSVFELVEQGGRFVKGPDIGGLPKEANAMNFAWIPADATQNMNLLAVVGAQENILTFNSSGSRLAKTDETYCGSFVSLITNLAMEGLLNDSPGQEAARSEYIPIRMLAAKLGNAKQYDLLAVRPISTAGSIFANYRTYPQGEIHALFWDGIGLDIEWKTRRIKGSIIDFNIADPNNDGVQDLVVNVNTYPGTFGVGQVRSVLFLYPLGQ